MRIVVYEGTLLYGHVDRKDELQPYERFTYTVNPDGSRTLRSLTESPNGSIVRDVHQTVDANWRSMEGYARLFIRGEWQGTIWRRLVGDKLHSHLLLPDGTTDDQIFDAPPGALLGFHCVIADAWKMNGYDMARGGLQDIAVFTVSDTWNGRTLGHGKINPSKIELVGQETVTVPAGSFECDHFLWHGPYGDCLETWRDQETRLLVQMHVHGPGRFYQLKSLERREGIYGV